MPISAKRRRLSLYFRLHPQNISHQEVYDFLWYLLKHLRGHVIDHLPAYAPPLTPIEAAGTLATIL